MDELNFTWFLKKSKISEKFTLYTNEELSNWFNQKSNLDGGSSYGNYLNRMSFSDYILDAYSIYLMQKYNQLKIEKIQEEKIKKYLNDKLKYNYYVQIWIEILKIDLSYLNIIKMDDNNSSSNLEIIVEKLSELKKLCKSFDIEGIRGLAKEILKINLESLNNKMRDLFLNEFLKIENLLVIEILNRERIKKISFIINDIVKAIPERLNDHNKQEAFKRIKSIINHINNHINYNNIECVKMILSKNKFDEGKKKLIDVTIKKMESIQMITQIHNERQETYDDLFQEDNNLIKLKKFFKKEERILSTTSEEEKVLNEKYYSGTGCFGVLETEYDNYFALSGDSDYTGSLHSYLTVNPLIFKLANKINDSLFNGKYKMATLNDEVERYINHDYERKKKNLSYIPSPVKLKNDRTVLSSAIGFHYSCCERKMQALCNNWTIDKTYYSRWEPCEKCLPSFDNEKGNFRIFALSKDFNAFKKGEIKLQEFEFKKILYLKNKNV